MKILIKPKYQYYFLVFPLSFAFCWVFAMLNYLLSKAKKFKIIFGSFLLYSLVLLLIPEYYVKITGIELQDLSWFIFLYLVNVSFSLRIIKDQEKFTMQNQDTNQSHTTGDIS